MHTNAVLPQAPSTPRRRHNLFGAFLAAAALVLGMLPGLAAAQKPTGPQPVLPKIQLSAGIHVIQAEVARTDEARERGLMFRQSLDGNEGMLFVFDQPDQQCFWMRNTPLPLSIAFMADDGTVVNIADMAPQTDDAHCSRKAVRYALEMKQGWFADHGLTAGKKIEGLP
jgi:uncharacterized membrane protein (UPF0127 family)